MEQIKRNCSEGKKNNTKTWTTEKNSEVEKNKTFFFFLNNYYCVVLCCIVSLHAHLFLYNFKNFILLFSNSPTSEFRVCFQGKCAIFVFRLLTVSVFLLGRFLIANGRSCFCRTSFFTWGVKFHSSTFHEWSLRLFQHK